MIAIDFVGPGNLSNENLIFIINLKYRICNLVLIQQNDWITSVNSGRDFTAKQLEFIFKLSGETIFFGNICNKIGVNLWFYTNWLF